MTNSENKKTYIVLPRFNMGMLTPEDVKQLAELVQRYEVPKIKITSAQRISFLGLASEKLAALKQELKVPDEQPHKRHQVHYVQACPGKEWCKYGTVDSLRMGERIREITFHKAFPYKVKVGVSGCGFCCTEPWVRDLGLFPRSKGWRIVFGGNAAGRPRIADLVAENLSDDEAVELVEKILRFYIDNAQFKTRSARFMNRFGIEFLKSGLGLE